MDVKELESKTVAELKKLAKGAGITGISSMKKADLVAALAGQIDEPEPEVEAAPEPTPEPEGEAPPEPAPAVEATFEPEPEPAVKTAPPSADVTSEAEEAEVEAAPVKPEPETEEIPEPAPGPEIESAPVPEPEPDVEVAPELATDTGPETEAAPEEAPAVGAAPAKKPEATPEPPKPEAVPTRTQVRLREKHDITALKNEKRALRSQILAAIADQDYKKLKELRNRKKELRRLLNRI